MLATYSNAAHTVEASCLSGLRARARVCLEWCLQVPAGQVLQRDVPEEGVEARAQALLLQLVVRGVSDSSSVAVTDEGVDARTQALLLQ